MIGPRTALVSGLAAAWCVVAGNILVAQEPAEAVAAERLEAMRGRIKSMVIRVRGEGQETRAELRPEPVFRYSDNVRQFPDASAWLWHVSGRPVAFCKLERLEGRDAGWQYCFVSLSDQLTAATWGAGKKWRSRKPGVVWSPVPQARPAQATESGRLLQMRQIARRFEGTILNPPMKRSEKMRLLSTPLVRYSSEAEGVRDGALFGLTSQGTTPDALLLIELLESDGGDQWRYAFQGATGDAVEVRLGGALVWSHPFTGVPGDYDDWVWIVLRDDSGATP